MQKAKCKPGDICIVTYPVESTLHGSVVKILNADIDESRWVVEHMRTKACVTFPDTFLTPVRQIFGVDETIYWAGRPPKVPGMEGKD